MLTFYSPDIVFITEPQSFQMDIKTHMEYFYGEYSSYLNSEDLYDQNLPLYSNCAHGGTLIMWRKFLHQFITVVEVDSSSYLPIILCLPDCLPSIHVCLYLPTSGKEAQFLRDLASLKVTLDDFLATYPDGAIFIRGDANASTKNTNRFKLLEGFISEYDLARVNISHLTYHHFIGEGKFDSDLDVLLFSNNKSVSEKLIHVNCSQEDPSIDSHHDALISACMLPKFFNMKRIVLDLPPAAPRIENKRHKIIWSEKGIEQYADITSSLLPGIRSRWVQSSSKAVTSVLLQATNYLFSSAASESNKVVSLASTKLDRSRSIPKSLRKSMNTLAMLNSRYKSLVIDQNASEEAICIAKNNLLLHKKRAS